VGLTRGCGGTAIESGGKFFVSKNYTNAEILANGPIRLQFRLHYAAWPAAGIDVSEEKIITLDAGTHMNRIQSTFSSEGVPSVHAGIGLATHARAEISENRQEGILSVWEPLTDSSAGMDGTGIVLSAGVTDTVARGDGNIYFLLNARANVPIVYFAGAGWSKSDIRDQDAWRRYLRDFSIDLQRPLQMSWEQ
jgi:unsaturated rhamnogalacturonyl hydrolase